MFNDDIKVIESNDGRYPEKLRSLGKSAPEKLYCIGDENILNKRCCAVVGSRKASGYGNWAAYNSGKTFAKNDIVTVSGMAYGCDTSAHKGALDTGGETIAVLGCGVDICYPARNRELRERIKNNGVIISEFPPGTKPLGYNFPRRNRIISGLSEEVVVAEAGISSGSIITAELAMEQGRDVLVFPGNISNLGCMGGNKLLQDGACAVTSFNDLISNLGLKYENKVESHQMSLEEETLMELLRKEGEMSADDISKALSLNISHINAMITLMEIKGLVCTSMGKVFIAN